MRVISIPHLRQDTSRYPDVKKQIENWCDVVKKAMRAHLSMNLTSLTDKLIILSFELCVDLIVVFPSCWLMSNACLMTRCESKPLRLCITTRKTGD